MKFSPRKSVKSMGPVPKTGTHGFNVWNSTLIWLGAYDGRVKRGDKVPLEWFDGQFMHFVYRFPQVTSLEICNCGEKQCRGYVLKVTPPPKLGESVTFPAFASFLSEAFALSQTAFGFMMKEQMVGALGAFASNIEGDEDDGNFGGAPPSVN